MILQVSYGTSENFQNLDKLFFMKSMTCKQLGGACDTAFHANSFEEMANLSRMHGMEMIQNGEQDHIAAMNEMSDLMKTPDAMNEWYEAKKKEFESLPEE